MPYSTENPDFSLTINDQPASEGIHRLVESIEFEDVDGLADKMEIVLKNPGYQISDSKIFAVGNEISFFAGYGTNLKYIGRARIYKNIPTFARNQMPTIRIVAFSRDYEMMHTAPVDASPKGRSGGKVKNSKKFQGQRGKRYKNVKFSEAIEQVCKDYGFTPDVDPTGPAPTDFIQKVGMTDFELVNGLANMTGFIFWVDADKSGKWTLHFKDPEKLSEQDFKFKFEHNIGDDTTLLEFQPEFLVADSIAQIRVRVLQAGTTGKVLDIEFSEDDLSRSPDTLYAGEPKDDVEKSPADSQSVQLFIGDYSFYEVTNRQFKSQDELVYWAKQWFRRSRQNFIFADGLSIGIPGIRSRQVHEIAGVGTMYSSDYYFQRVAYRIDENGFTLDFTCRKQTPKVT